LDDRVRPLMVRGRNDAFVELDYAEAITKTHENKVFVFSEGARNCKDFSVTILRAAEKVWS
jgi:hypothetical protein